MSAENGSKDLWDKLEVVSKIFSGVVLALIVVVLDSGAREISQSIQSGQLVERLITDLSAPDTTIRHGVALVALDRSIGDHQPEMIADICEEILRNRAYDLSTGDLAYEILRRRDPSRADSLLHRSLAELQQLRASSTDVSEVNGSDQPATEGETTGPRTAELSSTATKVLNNVVFVQFRGEDHRSLVETLRDSLEVRGFNLPGLENIDADYGNSVRYFHGEDRRLADSLARAVMAFFERQGRPLEFETRRLSRYAAEVPRGQLEVWIDPDAKD